MCGKYSNMYAGGGMQLKFSHDHILFILDKYQQISFLFAILWYCIVFYFIIVKK